MVEISLPLSHFTEQCTANRHWLPTNLTLLSNLSLLVFVKQVKNLFKTKTGLTNQVNLKVSKKGEGSRSSFPFKMPLARSPSPIECRLKK